MCSYASSVLACPNNTTKEKSRHFQETRKSVEKRAALKIKGQAGLTGTQQWDIEEANLVPD